MNNWILLIIALVCILPLPTWVVKRANRQRPYKAVLLLAFALTGALLYAIYNGYFSAQISEVLFAAGVYGAITCATTLVFMLFGFKHKGEGYQPLYEPEALEQAREKTRNFLGAHSGRDDDKSYDELHDEFHEGYYKGFYSNWSKTGF